MTISIQRYRLSLKKDGILKLSEPNLGDSHRVASLAWEELKDEPYEVCLAFFLNAQNDVVGFQRVATSGDVSRVHVSPRPIFAAAILANASAVILAHNHPSGDSTASRDDLEFTRRVKAMGEVLFLPILDHVIVARSKTGRMAHSSMANLNLGGFE